MVTVYYAGPTKPEKRTCETFGYPHRDNKGETQYENTHFKTISEAWERVIAEAKAGFEISVRRLKQAEREVEKEKDNLAEASKDLFEVEQNKQSFERGELII